MRHIGGMKDSKYNVKLPVVLGGISRIILYILTLTRKPIFGYGSRVYYMVPIYGQ